MALSAKSYRFTAETLERLEGLKRKLGVRYDAVILEMAVKRMAEQEQVEVALKVEKEKEQK